MSSISMAFLINPKKIPSMPEHKELDDKYSELLHSLDLPPMKTKEMRSYSDDKKWEILCSSIFVKSQNLPLHYISRLNQLFGLSFFRTKHDVTEVLRGLEVSLRTYSVEWLRSFLNDKHKGLDTLTNISQPNANILTQDNLQIVLQCMKTIFNDKNGLQMIINHENLLNVLTMNLLKASMKNKSLILQLLAIPCTVCNGHCNILNAFKNYQTLTGSVSRFVVLIDFLSDFKNNQTLIVYCLKMIGAIIFNPADINYRITLQYEFDQNGLGAKLEKFTLNLSLLNTELIEEIDMFKSKLIDVNKLIEHCDINVTAVKRVKELEVQLNNALEKFHEIESGLLTRTNGVKLKSNSLESEINILSQKHQKSQEGTTVLEANRSRNISICLRKLKLDINTICNAINTYNLTQLSLDYVELLEKVAPNEEEIKLYKNYINEKKDVHALSVEDKFLLNLINVDHLIIKLSIMNYIGNFEDRVNSLDLQLYAIISASHSLKSSKKFHSVLELVLTFGNYMNSSKRTGPAYGFKLKSLDALTDTKSNDKTTSLLEYIVCETITIKFPLLLSLDTELLCIEEAARISLRNVLNEINDMDKGWHILTKENELKNNSTLKLFEESCSEKYLKLLENSKDAKSNFIKCVEYFGESFQAIDSNEFFAIVVKFLKQFKIFACKVKTS
ncbi:unnamed protein product [Diamesa tonsa]